MLIKKLKTLRIAIVDVLHVILLYFFLGIAFTGASLLVSSSEVRIGTFRPLAAIPIHEFALFAMSILISGIAIIANRKFDFSLLLLPPVLVIFLDIDHLPSALGLTQPIRPAHSIFFIAIFSLLLFFALKKPASFSFLSISSFAGHLAVDNGVFAILAPFSFKYYSLAAYKTELFILSLCLAAIAGYLHAKSNRASSAKYNKSYSTHKEEQFTVS